MKTYLICFGIAVCFLLISYIWGKFFLLRIKANADLSSSILFGFFAVLFSYQIPYLIVFLLRGSYRILSMAWFGIALIITIFLFIWIIKKNKKLVSFSNITRRQVLLTGSVAVYIVFMCVFISMHVPGYGQDINTYISTMNKMYSDDVIWISAGEANIHNGLNSLFGLMTLPSLLLHIRPYYISLFSMRVLLVILTALTIYQTGKIVFGKNDEIISCSALLLCALVVTILMFWNSMYQPHFFFRRSNEAKAYCQFILLPLGFSVYLDMCKGAKERKTLWKKQLLIGLSAVAVSMSSLTGYPLLVIIGMFAVLAYDKLKESAQTILFSIFCVIPNLIFLALYFLTKKGYIVF